MHTYREIIYAILDEAKVISDDALLENEHLIYIANKYRALLFNQKYKGKKVEIPTSWYQRLNVGFTTKMANSNIYKSIKQLPNTIDMGNQWLYTFASISGIGSNYLNVINSHRFKNVGFNKWTSKQTYCTIDVDKYMYLNSVNTVPFQNKNKVLSVSNGRLYNLYSADPNANQLIPDGWRIPTKQDVDDLVAYLGGISIAGKHLKSAGDTLWVNGAADNSSGFTSLPSGRWDSTKSYPQLIGQQSYTLFSEPGNPDNNIGGYFILSAWDDGIAFSYEGLSSTKTGSSIRIIKEDSNYVSSVSDSDGNTYETVMIGSQVWSKQNFSSTKYTDGSSIGNDFSENLPAFATFENEIDYSYTSTDGNIGYIYCDTILDNPIDADRFNEVNTLDILDLEFPCEESLIQPIIDLCLKEVGVINNIPRDAVNNATDDMSIPKQQLQQ